MNHLLEGCQSGCVTSLHMNYNIFRIMVKAACNNLITILFL